MGGDEAVVSKGKSEAILEAVLRVERRLEIVNERVGGFAGRAESVPRRVLGVDAMIAAGGSPVEQMSAASRSQYSPTLTRVGAAAAASVDGVDNAVISASHESTTESILGWPVFDAVPALRQAREQNETVFGLENGRTPLSLSSEWVEMPRLSEGEVDHVLHAFQAGVNFCYPVILLRDITLSRQVILARHPNEGLDSCLALLIMALGCAAEVVSELLPREQDPAFVPSRHYQSLSLQYFDLAIKQIHHAHSTINTISAQCLMLAALFYAYLQRPLQAWSMLSSAATKCRVLLAYPSPPTTTTTPTLSFSSAECIRRIFWSIFILESDYVSELNALPHFGVAEIESSVPLPSHFNTHSDPQQESHSSLYFLACISMRRLLNRVHHLLFAKGSLPDDGIRITDPRLPSMVRELDEQLSMWRDLLPPAFRFTVDTQPVQSQHGAFLRQRYLTCKALIYRPYLMSALSNHKPLVVGRQTRDDTIDSCKIWIQACMLHILNLRSYTHTVLVDTWICALSMAGTMAMLLAAVRTPVLRECLLGEEKGEELRRLGRHLMGLLGRWMEMPGGGVGEVSPSVERAVGWIVALDEILREEDMNRV